MPVIEYISCNSGGTWWLTDEHWRKLAAAGWDIQIGCGRRRARRCLADLRSAIQEWEQVTGLDASEEGCGCCGPPHAFTDGEKWISGAKIAVLMTGVNLTHREALERLADIFDPLRDLRQGE